MVSKTLTAMMVGVMAVSLFLTGEALAETHIGTLPQRGTLVMTDNFLIAAFIDPIPSICTGTIKNSKFFAVACHAAVARPPVPEGFPEEGQ